MKKWKLIAIISSVLIVVALATTLIIIFTRNNNKPDDGSTYKYPSVEPTLSNPNDVFIQLGSRGVTNLEIYNAGILSYGLNVLNDLIDTKLFSDLNISDEELLNHKRSIYATYNEIEEDLDSESLLEKGTTEQPIVETTRRIKDEMKYFL